MSIRTFFPLIALFILFGCCHTQDAFVPVTPTSTSAFLGPDDFSGSYTGPGDMPDIGGSTDYDGNIVFTNLPRTTVNDILPAELELAVNNEQPTQHPVILVFGKQTNLTWKLGGVEITFPGGYNELILIIPFVQKQGHQEWHNFVVRMYLDWEDGVTGGNWFFGYRKQLAAFAETVGATTKLDVLRAAVEYFTADVASSGAWLDDATASGSLPNYDAMKQIFDMPMLGTKTAPNGDVYFVCSYFLYDFADTKIRASKVDHAYLQNFVSGMSSWVTAGALSGLSEGTYAVDDLGWELTSAQACKF